MLFRSRRNLRIPLLAAATVIAAALYLAGITFGQQNWNPERKDSYGKITRSALDRLLASAEKLQAGDAAGAKLLLQGMQGDIAELSRATGFFREQANREFDRCSDHIGALDTPIGDLYQQETQLKRQIEDAEAQLAGLTVKTQLTQNQIQELNQSLGAAQRQLAERQKKLKELEKWWWVPFYGAYLGIRTLVDDDIGKQNSLIHTLNDTSTQLARNQQDLQAVNALKTALSNEMAAMDKTHKALQEMRLSAETDLGYLKEDAVFLTDAQVFWGRADFLVTQNVTQSVKAATDIANLRTLLTKENSSPLFSNQKKRPLVELYDSLVAFADTLDQGNNFLLKEGSEFCGGPPRSKSGANISSKCNIEQFTQYYEIVDPKTCTFRYLNPPGCPPRPKPAAVTDQTVAAGQGRGVWVRAPDQNWIGKARCGSPLVRYYGKLNALEDCERACMSNSNCAFWTYNRNNGYMGIDSIRECWGAAAEFVPNKSSWSGFQSGGVSAK